MIFFYYESKFKIICFLGWGVLGGGVEGGEKLE